VKELNPTVNKIRGKHFTKILEEETERERRRESERKWERKSREIIEGDKERKLKQCVMFRNRIFYL
jgi:hypothetical protein